MPIYTFICPRCKFEFEVVRVVRDYDTPTMCVRCGNGPAERIYSPPALIQVK